MSAFFFISDINPREIVTSIVEAANRKLRGEALETEKVSGPGTEQPSKFNERNIDQEIVRRRNLEKIETTSRSSPNLAAMQRPSDVLKSSTPELAPDRRMAKSQEFDREFSDFDYIDSEKDSPPAYRNPTTRYFSDESLLDKNDEFELSHGNQNGSYSSRETINTLWRIEMEARTLRERKERQLREQEKRQLERQRIDQDILQTQQEIEIEDRHSVEDLLNAPDYAKFGVSSESPSRRRIDNLRSGSGDRSNSASRYSLRDSPSGGKYFVVKGNTQSPSYSRSSRPPRQTSVESLVMQSKRTGSLENMADGHSHGRSGSSRPMAQVRARKGDERSKRDSSEIKPRTSGLVKSAMRRGSLDSLIDMIEKRDSRMSWASTDSDEGYDLLTTLTSTFDQKLQNLSSAKTAQSTAPSVPRRMPYNSSNSSLNANTTSVDPGDSMACSAQNRLPPQAPLSMVNRQNQGSLSDLPSKQYRDPSLHRTPPKSDTKIGLATRFERPSNQSALHEGHSEPSLNLLARSSSSHGVNLQSDVTFSVDSAVLNNFSGVGRHQGMERSESDSRVSSVMVVISSPSVMSADSSGSFSTPSMVSKPLMSTVSGQSKWESYVSPPPTRYTEYRPITKSEKTEVNVKLSQSVDKNKVGACVTERCDVMTKSRSASPQPVSRKRSDKRRKRRHTVGGTSDTENMKAISEAVATKDEPRLSAWEQLQPNVGQHSNIGPNSSLLTWLRNERLRGSSPDLSMSRRDKTPLVKRN